MNCDRIARYYEVLERMSFGRHLERSRFAFLTETRTSRRAIVCGGGDGRFLARLLSSNPLVEVDFVDLSPRMVQLSERRVASMGLSFRERVSFRVGDVRDFALRPEGYDLIVTNYFFDFFTEQELSQLVSRLVGCASSRAQWIVSDFRVSDGPVGRVWTWAVIRSLYAAFRLTTGLRVTRLPRYVSALSKQGCLLRCEHTMFGGLLHSSLWTV
jgi:SAM-dependent methyltransferase